MGKVYSSKDVIKIIEKDGWFFIESNGDHHHFKHLIKKGRVTVPHPKKELNKHVVASISRQSGVRF